jgi:hypothetical protein
MHNKNRVILVLLILSTSVFSKSNAQQVRLQAGRNLAFFDYTNSEGEKLAALESNSNIAFSAAWRTLNPNSRFHFSGGLSYNRYSSRGSDPILGNYFDWNADYLGLDLSADFEIIRQTLFYGIHEQYLTICIKAIVSPEVLVQGTQTLNNQVINLKGVEQFDRPFLFVRGALNINYSIKKTWGIYAEYSGGRSLLTIGENKDPEEILLFNVHALYAGIFFKLPQ